MATLNDLTLLGQSVWYDYIRRSLLTSGELARLVAQGLGGVTSNPTIFEKAIVGSSDYDDALKTLIADATPVPDIYETLAISDITAAADILRPVYDTTEAKDGYVSLEVNPQLAHQTGATVAEARRLYEAVNRPNVMIKVPATPAGLPAIETLIGDGVNINVTLIFGIEVYREVAEAYLKGLATLNDRGPKVRGGHGIDRVASVASFFVSRVDTAVDRALEAAGHTDLLGRIAVANAKVAYAECQSIFSGPRWEGLAATGARVQRVLWASTGTKNPAYSDTLYVDHLIGPDTVNTMPPDTLAHFLDHGTAAETLTRGVDEARHQLARLADLDIDLGRITRQLQDDGVAAFANSFESLLAGIDTKRDRLVN